MENGTIGRRIASPRLFINDASKEAGARINVDAWDSRTPPPGGDATTTCCVA